MDFTVGRHGLKIDLESNQDKAFVEDTLNIRKEGDYVLLVPEFVQGGISIYALVTKSSDSTVSKKTDDNLLGLALGELRSIVGELCCSYNPAGSTCKDGEPQCQACKAHKRIEVLNTALFGAAFINCKFGAICTVFNISEGTTTSQLFTFASDQGLTAFIEKPVSNQGEILSIDQVIKK